MRRLACGAARIRYCVRTATGSSATPLRQRRQTMRVDSRRSELGFAVLQVGDNTPEDIGDRFGTSTADDTHDSGHEERSSFRHSRGGSELAMVTNLVAIPFCKKLTLAHGTRQRKR